MIEEAPKEAPSPPPEQPKAAEPAKAEAKTDTTLLNEKVAPVALVGAPEKYTEFKPPEGYTWDADSFATAEQLFKDANLSQAGAQRFVDLHTAALKEALEAPAKVWEETRTRWIDEVKRDPEIGGKLDQVKTIVARAIDGLGDPKLAQDFRQAMDFTGAGNNPAFIRAFYKLAQKVTEGTSVPGGTPVEVRSDGTIRQSGPRTAAHALYPNLK